jgi:uncharacterized protein with gpF-like domain
MGTSRPPTTIPEDLLVPFEEAIELFRERIPVADDIIDALEERHREQAFFVTGVSKAELLNDIKTELEKALEEGQSLEEFRDRLEEISERYGWKSGQNAWRQRLIYRQNLTNAYHAGRKEQSGQIQEERDTDVFILYRHGRPFEPRPHHVQWDGTVLPADHEAWETYWPPNGFNCTCKTFTLTQRQVERRELQVDEGFPETSPRLPDKGFRHAPGTGEARNTQREELLSKLSDRRRRQVLDEMREKGVDTPQ